VTTRLPDQLVVSLSDIEMGAGGVLDDFPHTPFLAGLLQAYAGPRFQDLEVHIVFNGDTFDFLKMPVDGAFPTAITESVALAKLDIVFRNHPDFFEGIAGFLRDKNGRGMVHFTVGNHDFEILFPAVQERIRQRIGHAGVHFPGVSVDFGDLHIEHGSQADSMFYIDPEHPFIDTPSGPILRLPWGSIALLEVAMPMHELVYDLDRLKPRNRVFELLPDLRDFVVGAFWDYWRHSARDWLGPDPVKRVSWTMLKDVAYRFRSKSTEVDGAESYRQTLLDEPSTRVITIGHFHQPSWWTHANRKLLVTGCLRDEFSLDRDGNITAILPKVYGEFFLCAGQVVRSHLVEIDGPTPAPGHFPTSVYDVLPRIRPLLAPHEERSRMRDAEADQHERECSDDCEPKPK